MGKGGEKGGVGRYIALVVGGIGAPSYVSIKRFIQKSQNSFDRVM